MGSQSVGAVGAALLGVWGPGQGVAPRVVPTWKSPTSVVSSSLNGMSASPELETSAAPGYGAAADGYSCRVPKSLQIAHQSILRSVLCDKSLFSFLYNNGLIQPKLRIHISGDGGVNFQHCR